MTSPRNDLEITPKKICAWSITYATAIAVICLLFQQTAFAKGLVLGAVFSVLNFILLGQTLPMALFKSRAKAGMIGVSSILGRYVLLAVPLIIGIKLPSFNFVAVVIGIFAIQITTLVSFFLVGPLLRGRG
ncbi:MAG: ATP synthase subunit I [Deltaproteobacteria bacterium]|nr:ATP synthase subunit I [Deltaproteobacteria bacterium]